MKWALGAAGLLLAGSVTLAQDIGDTELIREILRTTEPLPEPRGDRLPLYLWPAHRLGDIEGKELEAVLLALEARGMAAIASWAPNDEALAEALELGRAQARLGLPIAISATSSTYAFFNGDPRTAHIDEDGNRFFDETFSSTRKMGCPFAIDFRIPEMRQRIEEPVKAYEDAGLTIHFIYADWEIDGPLEWNGAWEHSKRCVRCRRQIPDIENFRSFQAAIREKRSELQRLMLAEPVKKSFPDALVGNYAVYPHDGYRYWYDYFETFVPEAPHVVDGGARHRPWFHEFPLTGYTFAMPVAYPWYRMYSWNDFENPDYRWFYNMLRPATNAAKSTSPDIPIIPFVRWHVTEPPPHPDPVVKPMRQEKYKELLWHLLLRGHDTFFMFSPKHEALVEAQLVYDVYRDSHRYREFLREGSPVSFEVPPSQGPVVSALRRGDELLVLRSDFDERDDVVVLEVDGAEVRVPKLDGENRVRLLTLDALASQSRSLSR